MDQNHVHALQQRHAGLDRKLNEELNRPAPDTGLVATLKKQKLRIKEAMQSH